MIMRKLLASFRVTLALAIGLVLAVSLLPASGRMARADPGELEWTKVTTPSEEDLVILPGSDIYGLAVGPDGDTIYAVGVFFDEDECGNVPKLWKSTDGGETWEDYTEEAISAENLPAGFEFDEFSAVAVAPDEGDFVAVAGDGSGGLSPRVVISNDGGTTFYDSRDLTDDSVTPPTQVVWITCMAISPEVDDIRNIAVGGVSQPVNGPGSLSGTVYRLEIDLDGLFAPYWKDATVALESRFTLTGSTSSKLFATWDGSFVDGISVVPAEAEGLDVNVTDWPRIPSGPPEEYTISYNDTSGAQTTTLLIWDNSGTPAWSWTPVPSNVLDITNITGFGLGKYPGWLGLSWVTSLAFSPNFGDDGAILCMGYRFSDAFYLQSGEWSNGGGAWNDEAGFPPAVKIKDGARVIEPSFVAFLTLSGMTGIALPSDYSGLDPDTCVAFVYVNGCTSLDRCGGFLFRIENDKVGPNCGPRGNCFLASIAYHGTIESGKAMVGLWSSKCEFECGPEPSDCCEGVQVYRATDLDCCCPQWEAACKPPSGQWMARVAFTPDGDKAYAITQGTGLSDESAFSVSLDDGYSWNQLGLIDTDIDFISDVAVCPDCETVYISTINNMECGCYCCDGECSPDCDSGGEVEDPILLRLPVDEAEDCCTIYLGDYDSDNLYYSLDCGQCWSKAAATKIDIQDIAVESENIVYVLNDEGYVSKSTDYGRRASDGVDTGIGSGHNITVMPGGKVLVGGMEGGEVAYSDDGGENFTLTDELPDAAGGEVHVAFDHICEGVIYAAVSGTGIYRGHLDSGEWEDMNAEPFNYYGIVLGRSDGTLYAPYCYDAIPYYYRGAARNLTPCDTPCCDEEDWDYLYAGLSADERFATEPSALRICGCSTIAQNSLLWAIDFEHYDLDEGVDGTLWVYEDCVAKIGPSLLSPVDGATIPCDTCNCQNEAFNLKWERLCVACSYDIELMDEEGNVIEQWLDKGIAGDPPQWYVEAGVIDQCGATYQWHVRVSDAETGEWLDSPWSETWSFTIEAPSGALTLIAPVNGKANTPVTNVGFSWTDVPNATSYSFVLSPNASLSGALASQEFSGTAYEYAGTLNYDTSYFWQVRAWKDSVILSQGPIWSFHTMPEPVTPQPPAVIKSPPQPVVEISPAQMTTPSWVYATVGVGCALTIVVIVLLVRRRKRY